ncbi:STS14 protein-like [Pyrus communis]|uniref:STS14 protein-like n=1 Tax=Pyrus communis TaxID=23211 RepID=UPI0035C10993
MAKAATRPGGEPPKRQQTLRPGRRPPQSPARTITPTSFGRLCGRGQCPNKYVDTPIKDLITSNTRSKIKWPIIVLAALALAMSSAHVAGAQAPSSNASAREYLQVHNQARAAVGVEPLKWSESLANATSRLVKYQKINQACNFANLTSGSKYGANQLWASGQSVSPTIVDTWVKEKDFYNHSGNSCVPNHRCGVCTQVVWRKSLKLRCAQATSVKEQSSLSICFYNPPGNVIGESPS